MTQQKALYLTEKNGIRTFEEGLDEVAEPRSGELLIKVHAAGLNVVEQRVRTTGFFVQHYPAILGVEASGTVEKVGPGVTGFQVGDKVLHQGIFNNFFYQSHITDNRLACYKEYTVCPAEIVAKVPSNITLDEAAGLPVALGTAASGLYGPQVPGGGVALTPPWVEDGVGKYTNVPIVILGGAGTTGQVAIQFAKLSGFSPIITTASLHNEGLLKSLGATHVLDRHSDVSASIASLSLPPIDIVYDAISTSETVSLGLSILGPGGTLIHILPPSDETKEKAAKEHPNKKLGAYVYGSAHVHREMGRGLYSKVTEWLLSGAIRPNKIEAIPGGLRGVSEGLKRAEDGGLSATKLVVRHAETE